MRARIQNRQQTASARPLMGVMPVQVAPAVNRKPTAMVMMKPQSISWACQNTPPSVPCSTLGKYTHSNTPMMAQKQPRE